MRKLLFDPINETTLPPQLAPSPSPSPSLSPLYYNYVSPPSSNADNDWFYNYFVPPGLPVTGDTGCELATVSIVIIILLLCLFSLLFIFHLRVKSQFSRHLQNFSSAWSIRVLLVTFISFWACNEIIRLPFFRQQYIYPYLPPLNLPQQANLCKFYVVFSLGFYEPGILVTLLVLVRISVKNHSPKQSHAITKVGSMCLPVFMGQIFVVFFSPLQAQLPEIFYRSSLILKDINGNMNVFCTYSLSSTIVFTGFGMLYTLGFSMACWKVLSVVINKAIINRINFLALTIMTAIPMQSMLLGLSSLSSPGNKTFNSIITAVFFCAAVCVMVGLCVLVIKPTADALYTAAELSWLNSKVKPLPVEKNKGEDDWKQ